ncbi:hypothetical protein ACWDUL_21040 [Nocardia niigatensis]
MTSTALDQLYNYLHTLAGHDGRIPVQDCGCISYAGVTLRLREPGQTWIAAADLLADVALLRERARSRTTGVQDADFTVLASASFTHEHPSQRMQVTRIATGMRYSRADMPERTVNATASQANRITKALKATAAQATRRGVTGQELLDQLKPIIGETAAWNITIMLNNP